MTTITFDELQKRLDKYVRRARDGETVAVQQEGEPEILLTPSVGTETDDATEAALEKLRRSGLARQVRPNARGSYPRFQKVLKSGSSQELLDWERGDR